jgi:hypothetical protein
VEITDLTHPLWGRRFELAPQHHARGNPEHLFLRYRDGIVLRVPFSASSLSTWNSDTPVAKLSVVAVEEIVALVKEYESCRRPSKKSGRRSRRTSGKHSSRN